MARRRRGGKQKRIVGFVLIGVGGIVVICLLPAWVWVLLLGLVFVVAGILLLCWKS